MQKKTKTLLTEKIIKLKPQDYRRNIRKEKRNPKLRKVEEWITINSQRKQKSFPHLYMQIYPWKMSCYGNKTLKSFAKQW